MSAKIKQLIREVFAAVEFDHPDKSTEYLFEITRQLMEKAGHIVDASDIAEALEP